MTGSSSRTPTTKVTKTTRATKASKSTATATATARKGAKSATPPAASTKPTGKKSAAKPAGATKTAPARPRPATATPAKAAAKKIPANAAADAAPPKTRLLSGGNPQVPKGDGDTAVQGYIRAIPDWKRDVAQQLDTLITETIPGVRKGVRWNSAFYGVEGGWHMAFHCITRYMKVAFFQGAALRPMPPEASAQADVRYLHVHEGTPIDAVQFRKWVRQAFALPPTKM